MIPASLPANEAQRLQALRDLLILDTPPEQRFDRIVQFAADEFDVPVALISLVDSRRQWFKARVGLRIPETPRDVSFCAHALHGPELLLVENATRDPRFFDNPLVTGETHLRFYAGAPLVLRSGAIVGTLCVIDKQERGFDAIDRSILSVLGQLVVSELEAQEPAR